MLWLSGLLFFLLSPGVLLTIPAGSKGLWMSCQTSCAAAAVHAVLFVIVSHFVWNFYKTHYEGFANIGAPCHENGDCQGGTCVNGKCAASHR